MNRRTATAVLGSVVVSAAGCLAENSPTDDATPSPSADGRTDDPTDQPVVVRNEWRRSVTVNLRISQIDDDTVVLDEQFQLASRMSRSVSVTNGTPPFRVAVSTPDGPVESIFGHRWDATDPLAVALHEDGVDFY